MKVPKFIETALHTRARAADTLSAADQKISRWCEKHDIEVENCDTRGGVEMYVNPWDSAIRVINAIERKED